MGSKAEAVESWDVKKIRGEFPAIDQEVHPGVRLTYLDSAATSLKPRCVIDAVVGYMAEYPANVHRGLHALSERATDAFESARERIGRFLGTEDSGEIIFTRGATESVNLVAGSWARSTLQDGDEILLSVLEHHSNMVPWQLAARETGAKLVYADVTEDGRLELEAVERAFSKRTKLVAITGMSNVLGTVPPVAEVVKLAHERGAKVLVDGAQSVPHQRVDVRGLDIDFLAFSGHKLFGPTGIGVLYAKRELLETMPPVQGGGSMVLRVEKERAEWTEIPWKFEAGTPPIAEAIGLGAAVEFLEGLDWDALHAHERKLTEKGHKVLGEMPGVRILGPSVEKKGSILALWLEGIHPHDIAQISDRHGVAIRAGHHCAMPLHKQLGVPATARASLAMYNTIDDVERLAEALQATQKMFQERRSGRGRKV